MIIHPWTMYNKSIKVKSPAHCTWPRIPKCNWSSNIPWARKPWHLPMAAFWACWIFCKNSCFRASLNPPESLPRPRLNLTPAVTNTGGLWLVAPLLLSSDLLVLMGERLLCFFSGREFLCSGDRWRRLWLGERRRRRRLSLELLWWRRWPSLCLRSLEERLRECLSLDLDRLRRLDLRCNIQSFELLSSMLSAIIQGLTAIIPGLAEKKVHEVQPSQYFRFLSLIHD